MAVTGDRVLYPGAMLWIRPSESICAPLTYPRKIFILILASKNAFLNDWLGCTLISNQFHWYIFNEVLASNLPKVKEVVALRHVIEQVQIFSITPRINCNFPFIAQLSLTDCAETAVKSRMQLCKLRGALQFGEGKSILGYMMTFFQRVSNDSTSLVKYQTINGAILVAESI
jgi:hypothetical protein